MFYLQRRSLFHKLSGVIEYGQPITFISPDLNTRYFRFNLKTLDFSWTNTEQDIIS